MVSYNSLTPPFENHVKNNSQVAKIDILKKTAPARPTSCRPKQPPPHRGGPASPTAPGAKAVVAWKYLGPGVLRPAAWMADCSKRSYVLAGCVRRHGCRSVPSALFLRRAKRCLPAATGSPTGALRGTPRSKRREKGRGKNGSELLLPQSQGVAVADSGGCPPGGPVSSPPRLFCRSHPGRQPTAPLTNSLNPSARSSIPRPRAGASPAGRCQPTSARISTLTASTSVSARRCQPLPPR